MQITIQQAQMYASQAGFVGQQITDIVAIAQAESGLNTSAQNKNSDGSIDRGILQINNRWHSDISDACAFDAACSFQSAHNIFVGWGNSFNAWTTYTNGRYKQFLQNASIGNVTSATSSTTISQLFRKNGLDEWYNNRTGYSFGQHDEKGQDYSMHKGFNSPVGCIMGGKVVMVSKLNSRPPTPCSTSENSVGWVVQILTPEDGLHHYQHLRSAHVNINDIISSGDTVGLSGGCAEGFYGSGNRCTCDDGWSSAGHIEVRWTPNGTKSGWNQEWHDPYQHFKDLSLQPAQFTPTAGIHYTSQFSLGDTSKAFVNSVHLKPTEDMVAFLSGIDENLALTDPFPPYPNSGNPLDFFSWVGEGLGNAWTNFTRMLLRLIIIMTGIYICWKVLNQVVNIAGTGQSIKNTLIGGISTGVKIAEMGGVV